MNILQVVYQQLPIGVNCALLLLYTFIYLYMNFILRYTYHGLFFHFFLFNDDIVK